MHFIEHGQILFGGQAKSYNSDFRPDKLAQLVLDIVSSLGEPAPTTAFDHSWAIVSDGLSFSPTGKRNKATGVASEVQRCLAYDPRRRMTAEQLQEHGFLEHGRRRSVND